MSTTSKETIQAAKKATRHALRMASFETDIVKASRVVRELADRGLLLQTDNECYCDNPKLCCMVHGTHVALGMMHAGCVLR
jgi:hypothetical protein